MDKIAIENGIELKTIIESVFKLVEQSELDIDYAAAVISTFVNSNYVRVRRVELDPGFIPTVTNADIKKEAVGLENRRLQTPYKLA